MEQLTIGNIVTVSVNLYRQNFKQYLKISFIAHLWLIIPVYGWGKYLEIAADISYESFKQLLLFQSTNYQLKKINSSFLWLRYLFTFLLNFLICLIFSSFSLAFIFLFIFAIALIVGNNFLNQINDSIVGTVFLICIILSFVYPCSRLFTIDLVLIESENKNIFTSTFKSIYFTTRYSLKTLAIVLLSFIITLPLIIISFSIIIFIAAFFIALFQQMAETELDSNKILWICTIFWYLFLNLVTMPLWQSVKAAAYYQIMCDKQAFDLTISLS